MEKYIYNSTNIDLEKIGELLKSGNLIVYPTDTVYGVAGVMAVDTIKKIYKAKNRSFSSPLIALVDSKERIKEIAVISDENREKIEKLMEKFWPGGLTIILKKKKEVPDIMTAGGDTVGVRMPNLKIALEIIKKAGGVLPTTSANISGQSTPRAFKELSEEFKERVDILIDGGYSPVGHESTIVDMSGQPKILRVGAIPIKDIEKIIGKI